jgi:hypothetical protein
MRDTATSRVDVKLDHLQRKADNLVVTSRGAASAALRAEANASDAARASRSIGWQIATGAVLGLLAVVVGAIAGFVFAKLLTMVLPW